MATVIIDPVGDITAVEGNNLTISCTGGANQGATLILRENGIQLVQDVQPPAETNDTTRTFYLPVDRTRNGNTYNCEAAITGMMSSTLTLSVTCKLRWQDIWQFQVCVLYSWEWRFKSWMLLKKAI